MAVSQLYGNFLFAWNCAQPFLVSELLDRIKQLTDIERIAFPYRGGNPFNVVKFCALLLSASGERLTHTGTSAAGFAAGLGTRLFHAAFFSRALSRRFFAA